MSSSSLSDLSSESLVTLDVPILYTDCANVGLFGAGKAEPLPFVDHSEVIESAAKKLCASIDPSLASPKVMALA